MVVEYDQLGIGLLVVTIWLGLGPSYSSGCYHHFHHPQNGDILVSANLEKWPL